MSGRGHRDIFASEIEWRDGSPGIKYNLHKLDEANPNSPLMVLSKFEPGTVVAPHTHDANYMEYIIEGEQTVGKTTFGPGDIRIVRGGTGYGPITVGPDGCTVIIFFEDATGAMQAPLKRDKKALEAAS
jgi:anti-sigma factor ChrR (cupin superfamily)